MHMEQVYKQWNNEKKPGSSGICKADIIMVVIYYCLDKENYKVFEFPMNDVCYFEIRDSLFKPPSNKGRTSKLQN